jgi:protein phosphatase 1 regulatory subunit 21
LNLSEDDKKREEELKKYYEDKYNQFYGQLQVADKKAMDLFKKKQSLEEKLKQMMNEREVKEKELDQLSAKQKSTQEDLDTTRTNYEGQLQMMSEHLIGLSDKIGKYEAELAYLKESKVSSR